MWHYDGNQKSPEVQEMLHWQHNAMTMMYQKILKLFLRRKLRLNLQIILFFCLTKREHPNERYVHAGQTPTCPKYFPNGSMRHVH